MKTRINFVAVLTIITLALSFFVPVALAQSSKPISKKELKVLLKTAKDPADHRKIAEYYRQEAQRLTARSNGHAAEVGPLTQSRTFAAMESKHPGAYGPTPSHCRYWANEYAAEAEKATKLAVLHEGMAQKTGLQQAELINTSVGR